MTIPENEITTWPALQDHCEARHDPINDSLKRIHYRLDNIGKAITAVLLTIIAALAVQLIMQLRISERAATQPQPIEINIKDLPLGGVGGRDQP